MYYLAKLFIYFGSFCTSHWHPHVSVKIVLLAKHWFKLKVWYFYINKHILTRRSLIPFYCDLRSISVKSIPPIKYIGAMSFVFLLIEPQATPNPRLLILLTKSHINRKEKNFLLLSSIPAIDQCARLVCCVCVWIRRDRITSRWTESDS